MNSTAALIISVVIAFGITAGLGFVIIPWLRKLKSVKLFLTSVLSGTNQSRAHLIWAVLCLLSVSLFHLL